MINQIAQRVGRLGGTTAPSILLFLLMFGIYAAHEPSAISPFGISNLVNNAVVLALASAGLTIVILTGNLDLSGSGVVALSNVVVATTSTGVLGSSGSLAVVLAIGIVVGAVNGFLVAYLRLQSLAVTIGSLIICQGIALLVLPAPGGQVADAISDGVTGDLHGIPTAAIILIAAGLLWLILKNTRRGIALYAVGADEAAANLSGIDSRSTKLFAFVAAGICYAVAGFVYCAEIGSGDPRVSDSFLLFMFASVAIGGTSLTGGLGGVIGTIFGAGILTVMQKMLFALGVAEFYTNIFNGLIMIAAIFFGQLTPLVFRLTRREAT
ncbi:ABC transporter permease [Microvirga sp. G4-2]|uniref:ABC transporter permease n=1 Tax=Microvirga sp. G4-2 TaxID=3434467 RepID=UPI004043BAC8